MKTKAREIIEAMYESYGVVFEKNFEEDDDIGFHLPFFPIPYLTLLCSLTLKVFQQESTVISIKSPITIIGDLHGHFFDLIRYIQYFGLPPKHNYLFLGDIIDRGEFSLETISLIFILKVLYPDNIHVVRGNHEFDQLCHTQRFNSSISMLYPESSIYDSFISVFSFIPLAAVIDEDVFCVHGGIGPNITTVNTINSIERPIATFDNPIVASLLWSDPNESITDFQPSRRGIGYLFGRAPLETFLQVNNFSRLIRAHEVVHEGSATFFEGRLITIFSASFYCGIVQNSSATLTIDSDGEQINTFGPIPYRLHSETNFVRPKLPIISAPPIRTSTSLSVFQIMPQPTTRTRQSNHILHFADSSAKKRKITQSSSLTNQKWDEIQNYAYVHNASSAKRNPPPKLPQPPLPPTKDPHV